MKVLIGLQQTYGAEQHQSRTVEMRHIIQPIHPFVSIVEYLMQPLQVLVNNWELYRSA